MVSEHHKRAAKQPNLRRVLILLLVSWLVGITACAATLSDALYCFASWLPADVHLLIVITDGSCALPV
jgi:hypothetical protein